MKHVRVNFIPVEDMHHKLGITKFAYSALTSRPTRAYKRAYSSFAHVWNTLKSYRNCWAKGLPTACLGPPSPPKGNMSTSMVEQIVFQYSPCITVHYIACSTTYHQWSTQFTALCWDQAAQLKAAVGILYQGLPSCKRYGCPLRRWDDDFFVSSTKS